MAQPDLSPRAVLFDVYGTLLRVGPPAAEADLCWKRLFREFFGTAPEHSRLDFSVLCNQVIAQRHSADRARGIPYPEVLWPSVVAEVLPEFTQLSGAARAEFVFQQMQTGRTISLLEGAGEALTRLRARGCLLGIASNSQTYTLRELDEQLATTGHGLGLFDRDLSFWSFENGYSKPDPHVFQRLAARLEARGIAPAETLMVGDRLDNDIEPARARGWHAWQLKPPGSGSARGGSFRELCAALA